MKTLVDINLLPRKQARDITTPLIYGICGFFVLTVVILLWVFSTQANKELTEAESQLQTVQQLRQAIEETNRSPQSSSSSQRLANTVTWAEEYPVEMVPIMQELVRLLPSRGFVQSFSYSESGSLNVTVQFDASRDAAYYLHHLNEASYFQTVNLSSVSTSSVNEETTSDVLPRYIAQYELTYDRNAVKAEVEAATDDGGEE